MTERAWVRVAALAFVIVVGQASFTYLELEPDLVRVALVATVAATLWWLVDDVLRIDVASWDPVLPTYDRPDAAEDSVYHRVLTNHLTRDTGPALHRLLVGLARTRDPDLLDPELRAFADDPTQRLATTDIDRYLTKLEEPRDHE